MSKIHINEEEFNWGGFLIPQIWCIGNGVPIGYLSYVPILAPFVGIYLGFNGSRLAYEKQGWKYSNLDEFYKVQRRWTIAGIIIFLLTISFFVYLKFDTIYTIYNNRVVYNRFMKEVPEVEEDAKTKVQELIKSDKFKVYLDEYEKFDKNKFDAFFEDPYLDVEMYYKYNFSTRISSKLYYRKPSIHYWRIVYYKTKNEYREWHIFFREDKIYSAEYYDINTLEKDSYKKIAYYKPDKIITHQEMEELLKK